MSPPLAKLWKTLGRAIFGCWKQTGIASGWYYLSFEQWGSKFSPDELIPARLNNGCHVDCDLADHVQRQMFYWGLYEPVEAYLFVHLLKPGMNVVDAGANVGQYTLLASTCVGATGSVHSFEPVPFTFNRLQQHVHINSLTNVFPNMKALWSSKTRLSLSLPAKTDGNSGAYSVGGNELDTAVEACAVSLDSYKSDNKLGRIGLIKMDIEGAELFALQGMKEVLSQDRPNILMEVNKDACRTLNYSPNSIWDLLIGEMGYQAWAIKHSADICHPIYNLDDITQSNILFHSENLPAQVTHGWNLKSVLKWAKG